ncbi:hypothetical protein ACQJBY_016323 [Aegilops geniculata]
MAKAVPSVRAERAPFPSLGLFDRLHQSIPSLPPKSPKTLSGPLSSSPATKSIAAVSSPACTEMLLPLLRLSGHLRRAASALLPPRRLHGHLRRPLSAAASPPPWAMICRISVTPNTTRDASFWLAPPPSATLFSLPERVFSSMEHRRAGGYIDNYGSVVFASSGDGLLLLKATWHRFSAHASLDSPRPREVLAKELVEEEHVLYVCNPVTGQLVRLPPSWGTKHLTTATGILTQADRGRGPPKRYAAAQGRACSCTECAGRTGPINLRGPIFFYRPSMYIYQKQKLFRWRLGRWRPRLEPAARQLLIPRAHDR